VAGRELEACLWALSGGQHQMWAAQWHPLQGPRQGVSLGTLGLMALGLPSTITIYTTRDTHGAAAAYESAYAASEQCTGALLSIEPLGSIICGENT
jgi:hypothetical protein